MVAACELEIQGGAEKRESDGAGSPPEHNALYFPEELSMIANQEILPTHNRSSHSPSWRRRSPTKLSYPRLQSNSIDGLVQRTSNFADVFRDGHDASIPWDHGPLLNTCRRASVCSYPAAFPQTQPRMLVTILHLLRSSNPISGTCGSRFATRDLLLERLFHVS